MIHIRLTNQHALDKLAKQIHHATSNKKLYKVLGEALYTVHQVRFDKEQASPDGTKWAALSPAYQAKKRKNANKILIRDNYLKTLLRYQVDNSQVKFGSDRKYARLHQFGSHKTTGRGSGIPARPWLGVSSQNEHYLLAKATHYLRQVMKA